MDFTETHRERILQLGAGPGFQAAVRAYLGAAAADGLEQHLDRCRNARFTVAVLGSRGVGKSSLINALLRRPLVPAGAQRTADVLCMPFPVENGADRPGIVLADTPGYGAPNPEHERTTREFLHDVSAAIFVFSTTPPLLRPDLEFLRAARRYCRRFFFVQTVDGEPPDQVELARQYNARLLHPATESIYLIDIRAALAASDEAAFAASGAMALAGDLTAFIALGPYALTLRDAHLAVLTAAWRVRNELGKRRDQLEAALARAQAQARTQAEQEATAAHTALLRLQQILAAYQAELRLAERNWAQHLSTTAHRVEVDLSDLIGQGSCTKPVLEERAGALWQIACRELEADLTGQGDRLSEQLSRQLGPIRQSVSAGPAAGRARPVPDLGCGPAAGAHGSTFTLTSPTNLDLSRYADMFTNGAREECWRRAQAYFDQLAGWAAAEVASVKRAIDDRKQRADQAVQERLLLANRTQQSLEALTAEVHLQETQLAELLALAAEALV